MAQKASLGETPYNKLERNLRWLGRTMLIGMIYDLILGLSGLLLPLRGGSWLLPSMAPDPFYFFWPLFHLVLACFGLLAWMDIKRNVVIVTGMILARTVYALLVTITVSILHVSLVWVLFGGIYVLLALAHYVLLRLSDFGFWEVLIRAGNPPSFWRR